MQIDERFNPTLNQISAYREGIEYARRAIEESFKIARRLFDSIEKLPAMNHEGNAVRHGANMRVDNAYRHIIATTEYLKALDRDFYELTRLRYKYIGTSFISDVQYAEKYSHCDAEIARLESIIAERDNV